MLTSSKFQRLWPFPLAIAFCVGFVLSGQDWGQSSISPTIMASTLTLGIIVTGFVMTQRTMLMTLSGSRVMRIAAKTGFHLDMIDWLSDCIWAALGLTIVSGLGLFLPETTVCKWTLTPAVSGLLPLTIFLIIRNEWMVRLVVARHLKEEGSSGSRRS